MKQDFLDYVKRKKTYLMDSSSLFFGCDTYRDCFDNYGNLIIKNNIDTVIREYNRMDIWNRIWCYLTTPIHHYLVLSDIMMLQEMEEMPDIELATVCHKHRFGAYFAFMETIASDIQNAIEEYICNSGNDDAQMILINDRNISRLQKQVAALSSDISSMKTYLSGKAKP